MTRAPRLAFALAASVLAGAAGCGGSTTANSARGSDASSGSGGTGAVQGSGGAGATQASGGTGTLEGSVTGGSGGGGNTPGTGGSSGDAGTQQSCSDTEPCPAGQHCLTNKCWPGCLTREDCWVDGGSINVYCDQDYFCARCFTNKDCKPGQTCEYISGSGQLCIP